MEKRSFLFSFYLAKLFSPLQRDRSERSFIVRERLRTPPHQKNTLLPGKTLCFTAGSKTAFPLLWFVVNSSKYRWSGNNRSITLRSAYPGKIPFINIGRIWKAFLLYGKFVLHCPHTADPLRNLYCSLHLFSTVDKST